MTSNSSLSKPLASSRQTETTSTRSKQSCSLPSNNVASTRQTRGSYRRQLTAVRTGAPEAGIEAKRTVAVILEVLAGVRIPRVPRRRWGFRSHVIMCGKRGPCRAWRQRANHAPEAESSARTAGLQVWNGTWSLRAAIWRGIRRCADGPAGAGAAGACRATSIGDATR